MIELPERKSDLIFLALKNLEECEKDSKYKIDMYEWRLPINRTTKV